MTAIRKTYYLHSYGCQMNLADSGILSSAMEAAGYRPVADPADAGIVILNTCSVRERAEKRALGRLNELVRFKKEGDTFVCAVGCMAQRMGDGLIDSVPGIDFVLGTEKLFELPHLLARRNGAPLVDVAFSDNPAWAEYPPAPDSPYSAHVTVTRGCDNYCAYCIVPYLRGPERHREPQAVVNDINHLVEKGVVEVTLVGQNVNSYTCGDVQFPDLVRRAAADTGIERIRFITSHPKDLSDDLIDLFAAEPKLMAHIHLPLQSGSDRVLKQMFRKYTYTHYCRLVDRLRQARPDIAITTDLLVGYPTETEADFEQTINAVRDIRFDAASKNLDDDVLEREKLRRLQKLIQVQKDISNEVNQSEVGRVRSVLVDGTSRRDNTVWKGKTEGNKTILFEDSRDMLGRVVPVRVVRADSWTLHGEVA